jgi:ribose 5-phosphate isomerase A
MLVGLGTGSTAYFAVERVGAKLKSGELKDIKCIPTSVKTKEQAEKLKIPLITLDDLKKGEMLDVAIDGADAVDPDMCLIKGGGGALHREKMVEVMSKKFICIVDETKLCTGLGPSFPLPVEITPFCHEHTMRVVALLCCARETVLTTSLPRAKSPPSRTTAITLSTCTSRSPSPTSLRPPWP